VPELRIDQLTGMRTLIAPERATRPSDFAARFPEASGRADCPFCPGHESETPPELWANRPGGGEADTPGWEQRAVPNLYPALVAAPAERASVSESGLTSSADPLLASARASESDLFGGAPAAGAHEVIVNSARHVTSLAGLELDELSGAMGAWRQRIAAHSGEASLVHLLVNEGPSAGATREHTHAQLAALPFVPPLVARERERFTAYNQRTMGGHMLEDVVVEEVRRRERLVAIDGEAALICPWASRAPYEMRLVPRTAKARFEEDDRGAELLHRALGAMTAVLGEGVPLNLWVRTAPRAAEEFHWHIDLLPRLGTPGAFELGTGVDINAVAPESAAAALREALPG
jgi:UDPglucose--hexose-1-phosphate uridylyltransferase